jgi:outer membrane protein TolC
LKSLFQPISVSLAISCFLVAGIVGCTVIPRVEIEQDAAGHAGLGDPIAFSEVGGPIDERLPEFQALSLGDAISLTLRTDPRIQAAMARVRIAQADAKQARLISNPVLSVVLRWPTSGGGSPDIEAGLTAELISLLAKPGQISVADSRLRASAAEALSTVLDVLSEVQERYVAAQTSDELLAVIEDRSRIVERLLDVTQSRLNAGEGTRLDVLSLQAQRIEAEAEVAELRLERLDDRVRLARLIGVPSAATDWQLTPWEHRSIPSFPESRWIELGLENRPEIKQQQLELAAFGQELDLARYAAFEGADVGIDGERADGEWTIGPALELPIPIFDFGQARRERAGAVVIEARHKLTGLRRQIVEEVRRAHAAYVASRDNLDRVRNQLIPLARQRLDQAEAQFRGGQTDISGFLIAGQELRAAQIRQVELERRNSQAHIRLHRAVGGPAVIAKAAASTQPQ